MALPAALPTKGAEVYRPGPGGMLIPALIVLAASLVALAQLIAQTVYRAYVTYLARQEEESW